ncbi:MAG: hypothetical protein HYY93_13555 [Planctomycetes bacterium]|nr:hypothetical protein [Planctomycetota bacterium]
MRIRPRRAVLTLLALLAVLAARDADPQDDPPFKWRTDLETARAQAKTEKKPLLLVFR